jgi:hypothetical protein
MLDLFQRRCLLLPSRRGDPSVFIREVEIFGIGILETGFVARLPCQPLKKALDLGESRMQGRLAQFLTGSLPSVLGKVPLKRNRLLEMERLEITIAGVSFKAAQSLRGCIDREYSVTFGFF